MQLRVAHFSPDTPPMDVYATGFDGKEQLVLPKLGYGQVSEYLPLAAGVYAFSMRPAGSPATDEPVLRVSADLAAESSYTFAAFGRQAELNTDLLTDDLSAPPAGQGRVRLIQAAIDAGPVDVSADGGPLFAQGAELGSVGNYMAVPAGSWTITATGESADPVVGSPAVFVGHVDSRHGPAVFFRLAELGPGDLVEVTRTDGTIARFAVTDDFETAKDAFPTEAVYGPTAAPTLRLITCTGAFDRDARHYLSNLVVSAVPA